MRLATLHLETARYGDVYRAEMLAKLRRQVVRHIKRTDASAQKVEEALARLTEANAPTDRLAQYGRRPRAASFCRNFWK
ncbi:hypothetical protein D3227_20645 [Mesorhizobium waimense]|uniref:Uncharacterized protein n=1 Tax=Mesorhizobium waimense TaxID=1300307 RepID=A0A3A5KKA3_9HYPH|nr:hypothetical protein D3227_20645 [Mesorhizobium waimense]